MGKKAKSFVEGAEIANEIMMKMVNIVMSVAPYAVFALIAKAVATLGLGLLASLAGYVGVPCRGINVPPVCFFNDYFKGLLRFKPNDVS